MKAHILLAEDDHNLGFMTKEGLEEAGFRVDWACDGSEALKAFNNQDICLVDVMMPKMDGFTLAERIRELDKQVPILFLTAKSREKDRLKGFELGGDDYVTKPFSMQELVYRIQVFLKRRDSAAKASKEVFSDCEFELDNLTLKVGVEKHSLTQREGELLAVLIENKNQLVRREDLLVSIWGENDYFMGRSLDVFISRLRKYFAQNKGVEIRNHHGVGFQLICKK